MDLGSLLLASHFECRCEKVNLLPLLRRAASLETEGTSWADGGFAGHKEEARELAQHPLSVRYPNTRSFAIYAAGVTPLRPFQRRWPNGAVFRTSYWQKHARRLQGTGLQVWSNVIEPWRSL